MRERYRIACCIAERAAIECQAVGRNADAVGVRLVGKDGVGEDQCRAATARGVGRLYGGRTHQQPQGGRAAGGIDGGSLAHRDRDAEHVTRVQCAVGNPRGASDGNARYSEGRGCSCNGNVSRTCGTCIASCIGLRGAQGLCTLAHGANVGGNQGVAPAGARYRGGAHVASNAQGHGGASLVAAGDGAANFGRIDDVVSGHGVNIRGECDGIHDNAAPRAGRRPCGQCGCCFDGFAALPHGRDVGINERVAPGGAAHGGGAGVATDAQVDAGICDGHACDDGIFLTQAD